MDETKPFPTPRSWAERPLWDQLRTRWTNVQDPVSEIGILDDLFQKACDALEHESKHAEQLLQHVSQLRSEVEAGDKDEKEIYACRDRCVVLEGEADQWLERYKAEEKDNERLRTKVQELTQELNRLKDQRQQWLDRDRDNQIVIQTLKDVISDLR